MKPPERFPPDDPREWLNRARSNLELARARRPGVYLEDLCFELQQAAEKAIKAVILSRGIEPPYTHDLAALRSVLEDGGEEIPGAVQRCVRLTVYAVGARYPALKQAVTEQEYLDAMEIAETVVRWAGENW
jgi:HEPN domain-containing protein